MKLQIEWSDFKKQLETFIEQGLELYESNKRIKTQDELNDLETKYKSWDDETYNFLNSAFDEEQNEYAHGFYYAKSNRFQIPGKTKELPTLIKEKLEDIQIKTKTLRYYPKILGVCDAIIKSREVDLKSRRNLETDEILELLMEKLYELYDDHYHPVSAILAGNGIELGRYGEERELAKTLKNYGFVNFTNARDINAQLTIEGKRYVEEKRRAQKTDYSKITETPDELNQKIDEIKEELKKLGLGQEILFEELEDLKELYPQLNKKNWGQILKGKLIDLGLAQIINKETMAKIFEELTKEVLQIT